MCIYKMHKQKYVTLANFKCISVALDIHTGTRKVAHWVRAFAVCKHKDLSSNTQHQIRAWLDTHLSPSTTEAGAGHCWGLLAAKPAPSSASQGAKAESDNTEHPMSFSDLFP